MKRKLNKSIIVLSLLFLFFVGIYMGNKISYSVEVDNNNTNDNRVVSDIFLDSINFSVSEAKASDKIYVDINSSGAILDGATISLTRTDGKYSISLNVKDIETKPYVEIPKYVNTGEYNVKSVLLLGNDENANSISRNFTLSPKSSEDVLFNFNSKIKLTANIANLDFDVIKSVRLGTTTFRPGSKIPLEVDYDKDVRSIRLNFTLGTYRMYSYINSMAKNPYIIIPKSAKTGEYVLDEIYVETNNYGSVSYSFEKTEETKYLAYDTRYYVLSEENSESNVVYYNNSEISSDVIALIHNSDSIKEIEVMSEESTVISRDLFSAIEGTDKKLIVHYKDVKYEFAGRDIQETKTFNATVDYHLIEKDSDFNKYVSDGLVIEFAPNGDLPGKAKVTIQKNSLFNKAFKQSHVNIYYYNEKENSFELIKENLTIGKDDISFDINHTSSYLVTNSKIIGTKVYSEVEKKENSKTVKKLSKDNILLIIIVVLAIVVMILLVVLFNNMKKEETKKKTMEKDNEVDQTINDFKDEYADFDEEDLRENISKANDSSFDEEDE